MEWTSYIKILLYLYKFLKMKFSKKKKKIYLNSKITLPLQNTHQQWLKALPWKKVKFWKIMESSPVELRYPGVASKPIKYSTNH